MYSNTASITCQDPISRVLSKLTGVKRSGNGWVALCPAHDDQHQSLSIAQGADGRVLLKCHAGCRFKDIVRALGLGVRDFFPPKGKPKVPVATYSYVDEKGDLLFEVVRYEPKSFAQRRPGGKGGYIYNINGVRRVLYRLPDVIKAVQAGETVFVVEGEKDADALGALGVCATTNPHGAGKWRDEYSETLKGASVVIIPDKDDAGKRHAEAVAKSLWGKARAIKLLELPGEGVKDASDWLKAGGTKEELLKMVAQAPEWKPAAAESRAIEPATWDDVATTFSKWLELPDLDAIRVVLACYIANRMAGDPVWLFLVAPPSSSKTEMIMSLADLPDVYTLSTLTPNTFLSGKEPRDGKGEISLLPQLTGKVLLMKDFAPILQMNRDSQQAIFAQLRDIYDGRHERAVGSEKRTMRWEGKIGFIAGITQALDQFSNFLSLLGERFLQYRLIAAEEPKVVGRALRNIGRETAMRQELRRVITGFLQTIEIPHPQDVTIPDAIALRLEALVRLVIRARTGVIRDWHGAKEITYIPDHEGPARLTKQLAMLGMGLATLRGSREVTLEDYRVLYKVGLDSLHKMRRQALEILVQRENWSTADFAIEMGLSTLSARRILEDMAAIGVVGREKTGNYETAPDRWWLDPEKRDWWEVAQP